MTRSTGKKSRASQSQRLQAKVRLTCDGRSTCLRLCFRSGSGLDVEYLVSKHAQRRLADPSPPTQPKKRTNKAKEEDLELMGRSRQPTRSTSSAAVAVVVVIVALIRRGSGAVVVDI